MGINRTSVDTLAFYKFRELCYGYISDELLGQLNRRIDHFTLPTMRIEHNYARICKSPNITGSSWA